MDTPNSNCPMIDEKKKRITFDKKNFQNSFLQKKKTVLSGLDKSRKGSIDEHILNCVELINNLVCYFTTSTCSGRVVLYSLEREHGGEQLVAGKNKKRGCCWLYVSHESDIELEAVLKHLETIDSAASTTTDLNMKFEPMILHIQCVDLRSASNLLQVALASGCKNSGIVCNKNETQFTVAVRCADAMEVPLLVRNQNVSRAYIEALLDLLREKMLMNKARIDRFYSNLSNRFSTDGALEE